MSTNPRNSNILVVGNDKFINHVSSLLKNEEYPNVESFDKVEHAWTLIHAKKNIKPYHIIICDLKENDISTSNLYSAFFKL